MKTLLIVFVAALVCQSALASAPRLSCGNGQKGLSLVATVAGNGYLTDVKYTEQGQQATYPDLRADVYHGAKGDQYSVDGGDDTPIRIYLAKNLASGMKFTGSVNSSSFNFASVSLFCSVK